ncbi:unnamed protein product [Ilex paraguariensis]|uniref:Uncharacterized protein n=1 Tax=Ilex paraguariensis TaxID=185542 RepID=A0ABC8SXB9_9AQUA
MKEIHHKGGGRTGSNTSTWGGRGDVGNGHGSKTTARLLGKQIYGATPNPSIGTPSNPSLNQETFASALVEKQSGTSWSVVVEVAKDGGNMKSWNKAKDKGKEKINEEKGGQITIELQTSPSAVPDLGIFVELLGFLVLDGAAGLLLSVVVEVAKDGGNMKSWNKAKDKGKEKINEEKGGQITIELQTSPSAVPDLGIFVELLGFLVLDGAAGLLLSVVVEVAKDGGNMKSWNKAKDKGKEKINEEKGGQITIELQTSPSAVPDLGIFVELLGFLVLDGAAGLLLVCFFVLFC